MKKLLILMRFTSILLFCFPAMCFSQFNVALGIGYDWDELSKDDQKEILKVSEFYIDKLNNNQLEDFWNSTHPIFKEATPKNVFLQYEEFLTSSVCSLDSMKFINAKKIVYENPTTIGQIVTGGSWDKSNEDYLQFSAIPNIAVQVIIVYESLIIPIGKSIVMKFGEEKSIYSLFNIDINSRSIDGKGYHYFLNLAEQWKSNEYFFPEFVALNYAYKLSFLGQDTKCKDFLEVTDKIILLQNDKSFIEEFSEWKIENETYEIVNFDLLETKTDITPIIKYVSKKQLNEESTTEEARILLDYVKEKYPMFKNEFKAIMFQAYEEKPLLPTKQYQYYNVPLYFGD